MPIEVRALRYVVNAPVLTVYGEDDRRVMYYQMKDYHKQFDAAGKAGCKRLAGGKMKGARPVMAGPLSLVARICPPMSHPVPQYWTKVALSRCVHAGFWGRLGWANGCGGGCYWPFMPTCWLSTMSRAPRLPTRATASHSRLVLQVFVRLAKEPITRSLRQRT